VSELARSFGAEAEAYARGRPGWPVEAIDVVGLPPQATVLDLAAGTGKLTEVLRECFADVIAVEPDEAMRALVPGALAGSAESIPLEDASVDGVFVGEAFHWFDTPEAVAEIARVLRPRGTLALLWSVALNHLIPDEVWNATRGHAPSAKENSFETGEWRAAFAGSPFGPFDRADVPYEDRVTRDDLIAYYASLSWVAVQEPEARARDVARFAAAVDDRVYERRLRIEVHWAQRA
jgi:SAM-dependent methyltransferase